MNGYIDRELYGQKGLGSDTYESIKKAFIGE